MKFLKKFKIQFERENNAQQSFNHKFSVVPAPRIPCLPQ